jgi:hypothetical protein
MDHDHDVAGREPEGRGYRWVEDGSDLLHLEIVVAAAERAHLVALALFGMR